jgi:hypothetical protein
LSGFLAIAVIPECSAIAASLKERRCRILDLTQEGRGPKLSGSLTSSLGGD